MSGEVEGSVDYWVERIRPHIEGVQRFTMAVVESYLAVGEELLHAKSALDHGRFGELVETFGFTTRTAQRLMEITRNPVLRDATHVSHLPASWGTLYELTRLPPGELEAAITDGRVTTRLERSEAERMVRDWRRREAEAQALPPVSEATETTAAVVAEPDEVSAIDPIDGEISPEEAAWVDAVTDAYGVDIGDIMAPLIDGYGCALPFTADDLSVALDAIREVREALDRLEALLRERVAHPEWNRPEPDAYAPSTGGRSR